MKKLAATFIAAVTAAAMSAAVYAESPVNGADLDTDIPDIPVTVDYVEVPYTYTSYNVEISWGEMAFTYHEASEGEWQPETHAYEGARVAEWTVDTEGGNEITVKNRSNAAVNASFAFNAAQGYDVGADFSQDSVTLPTAENTTVETLPTETVTVTPTGSITEGEGVVIGTVTVTITETNMKN